MRRLFPAPTSDALILLATAADSCRRCRVLLLHRKLPRLIGAAIAAIVVAGCSGAAITPRAISATSHDSVHASVGQAVSARMGWLSPRARSGKGLIYVSDLANNVVDIFDAYGHHQKLIGQITDGFSNPTGVTTDKSGNLYVSSGQIAPFKVTVYSPGSVTPSVTYTQGISQPIGVAVDGSGRLYVANQGGYDVTEYPKGSTNPDRTISFSALEGNDPFGLALDAGGDLFVAAFGYPLAQAYELKRHSSTPQDLDINTVYVMHGIAVDALGNVLVADDGTHSIKIYPPGSNIMSMEITRGLLQPMLIALNRQQDRLYVADAGVTMNGTLRIYSYPAGRLINTITFPGNTLPYGVALSPS
jgi:hypothetical protein